MKSQSKLFKGLVIVLAVAIVVVGALVLWRTFGPVGQDEASLPQEITEEEAAGMKGLEITIDENGNHSYKELGVDDE